jgi:hypothetical protein
MPPKKKAEPPPPPRLYLIDCPHSEKDKAKALGAKWDASLKKWYIPDDC